MTNEKVKHFSDLPGGYFRLTTDGAVADCYDARFSETTGRVGDDMSSDEHHGSVPYPLVRWRHICAVLQNLIWRTYFITTTISINDTFKTLQRSTFLMWKFQKLTFEYRISMFSRGILTLVSFRYPLSFESNPNFVPMSPDSTPYRKYIIIKTQTRNLFPVMTRYER